MNHTNVAACYHLLGLLCTTGLLETASAADVTLYNTTHLHFASVSEARQVLTARDDFVISLSPFDRQSRLGSATPIPEPEFLEFVAAQALDWSDEQIDKVTEVAAKLRARLVEFHLPLPFRIDLIQTTGREEGNAAYCRGNAIVLPASKVGMPSKELERLLTHELFHILSRQDAQLRTSLYSIVGFQPAPDVYLPESLRDRKITNPDAPRLDSFISLDVENERLEAIPFLFATTDYDAHKKGTFFQYMLFRLMVVRRVGQSASTMTPAMKDGEVRLLIPSQVPDFARQIGKNTGYIIHPEEIMAENFVHLVYGTESLPNPEIVQQLRKRLSRAE